MVAHQIAVPKWVKVAAAIGVQYVAAMQLQTQAQSAASPVSEVVSVLEQMSTQLAEERETDDKMMKKMKCWCEDTDGEKRAAIEEAVKQVKQLEADITKKTGKINKLSAEIEQLTKDINEEENSLAAATTLRNEQIQKFQRVEAELVDGTTALQSAVAVLKKHNSFVQMPESMQTKLKSLITVYAATSDKLKKNPAQAKKVNQLLQAPTFGAYESQSTEIFGVLSTMLDNFSEDLEQARAEDMENAESFAATKLEKETSISNMSQKKSEKTVLKETTASSKAADMQNLSTTKDQLGADRDFLSNMQTDCKTYVEEYDLRTAERTKEIKAVDTALRYLHSDEARDLFGRGLSFAQFNSKASTSTTSGEKVKAAKVVEAFVAKNGGRPGLISLVKDIKEGAFDKVQKAIAKMIADLHKQIEKDTLDVTHCTADLKQGDLDIATTTDLKTKLTATNTSLNHMIATLSDEITELELMITETKKSTAKASAIREEENAAYQKTAKDQSNSIAVLNKALEVLKKVYAMASSPMPALFLQQKQPPNVAKIMMKNSMQGPHTAYARNAGGQQVIALIATIVGNAEKAKALTIESEQEAQKSYEEMVKDAHSAITQYERNKVDKKSERAMARSNLASTQEELAHTVTALTQFTEARVARADECQFLMNNYELRKQHMADEITALTTASNTLKNMVPSGPQAA